MLIELSRGDHGFIPIDDEAIDLLSKVNKYDTIVVEYKPKRNYKFHKKYWALLNAVYPNQSHFKSIDNLHEAVKYRAGYYETIIPLKGEPFIKTKSIAFYAMDESEFEKFYSSAIDVCLELVGESAVNDILRFI